MLSKLIPVPSSSMLTDRDIDKPPILECINLGINFGGLAAVENFNITVGRTEISGLIGPNGAGKTTIFNLLTKVYQPTRGTILLDGLDTAGKTTAQINRMGIARTFQNIRLFNNLSVEDNVKPILECINLGINFGGLAAVENFNITVGRTEISGLIGPNGAGKTTIFNLLTKVYQPTRGTILLDGLDTAGKTTAQINRMGIARTFQNIRLFNNLSVEDNVKIGLHNQTRYSALAGVLRLPSYWKQERAAHDRAMELLSIFDMEQMASFKAGSLPYGAQRRLEIVRALATNPSLLLLDEPAAGMNPSETAELMENIVKIRDTFQIAIMLIEHDMNLVMSICEGICVLNFGQVIAKGTRYSALAGVLRLPSYWKQERAAHDRAMELLSIFDMEQMASFKAGSLPYGAQRRLEIVRALATNPSLLLLDEPAAGMNPSETAELMENIVKIRDTFQIAIMLIEHDMNLVMSICEGICVLNFGQVIAKGTAEEIQSNPTVIEAYLGKQKEA